MWVMSQIQIEFYLKQCANSMVREVATEKGIFLLILLETPSCYLKPQTVLSQTENRFHCLAQQYRQDIIMRLTVVGHWPQMAANLLLPILMAHCLTVYYPGIFQRAFQLVISFHVFSALQQVQ